MSARRTTGQPRPSTQWRFLLANAAAVSLSAAIAGWALFPVYDSTRYVATIALAIVAGVTIAVLCAVRGRGVGTVLVAGLGVYVAGGLALAVPGALTGLGPFASGLLELVRGPVLGWKEIVTLPLPLGTYQATLVPVFALFLMTCAVATWVAVRWTKVWALAAVMMVLLLAVVITVGPAIRAEPLDWAPAELPLSPELLVGLGLLLVVLSWCGWRASYMRRSAIAAAEGSHAVRLVRAPRSRLVTNAVAVVGVATAATVIGALIAAPLAASTPREVARSAIEPRLTLAAAVSPLASYRTYFQDAAYNAVLFRVDVTAGNPERVRLASLSHFDGETFSATAPAGQAPVRFQRVPSTIDGASGTAQVAANVTMGVGGGIWVPLLGELGSVTFQGDRQSQLVDGFYYLHDDVAAVTGVEGGIGSGDSYTVSAHVPTERTGLAELGSAPGVTTIDRDLIPASVADWVALQDVSRDGAGLATLIERLRARGYLSHALDQPVAGSIPDWQRSLGDYTFAASPAGHSYDRIDRLFLELLDREGAVGGDPEASLVAAVGDDEQFAAAAAVVAAEMGYPSRVVVGARLVETDPHGWAPPPCEAGACRGENLTAWVEVQGANGQWVAADVSPQYETPLAPDVSTQRDPEFPTALDPQRAEPIVPPATQRGTTSETDVVDEDDDEGASVLWTVIRITGVSLLVLLVVAGPLLAIVLWKVLRRARRRNAHNAGAAIHGGWDEYVDTAVEAGHEPLPLATRWETAQQYGSPAGMRIAELTDRATYSAVTLSSDHVTDLWDMVAADRQAWLAEKGWWARMRMRLSLRSTWRSLMTPTAPPIVTRKEQNPRWRTGHTSHTHMRRTASGSHRQRRRWRGKGV